MGQLFTNAKNQLFTNAKKTATKPNRSGTRPPTCPLKIKKTKRSCP